ncbi:extensin isoform X2 [Haplochromis burtoni]|uniref:extensin isoform X2 n=1 Tax=Haplochromis burtoni TaxID=8153 RepID=UPI0003BC984E|nr:extensin isoform X2 [Haplochromis burtoni]
MDFRLQEKSHLYYKVNGSSRPGDDQDLSQEEQDCIQFFEKTIDSLEASLEEDDWRLVRARPFENATQEVTRPVAMSANPYDTNPKDHDIIDLVHKEADSVHSKEPIFSPNHRGFQTMVPPPESHFETKPRHNPMDSLPSEYNPPLPSGMSGQTNTPYHPAGSVPTPVLIAKKIAENQSGGTANFLPSLHHLSMDEKPSTDHPVKQGPPTSAKPTHYPDNINMIIGSKDRQNQPPPNVSIQEKQAHMLANLGTGSSPTPLEAHHPTTTETGPKSPEAHVTTPPQTLTHADRKPEVRRTSSSRSNDDRNPQPSLSRPAVAQSSSYPPPVENKVSIPQQPSEVTSLALNSYGGKSIVVHPSVGSKSEPAPSTTSHEPRTHASALSNPSDPNTYGGKSKVMTPGSLSGSRTELPDILSSHVDRGQTLPYKSELLQPEHNSYGGKSRNFNPVTSTSVYRTSENPARGSKPPAPTPAPRPPRHIVPQKPASSLSADNRRRSNSMFRPQGITVQFSGRGEMNESRREALRKLGLLKKS